MSKFRTTLAMTFIASVCLLSSLAEARPVRSIRGVIAAIKSVVPADYSEKDTLFKALDASPIQPSELRHFEMSPDEQGEMLPYFWDRLYNTMMEQVVAKGLDKVEWGKTALEIFAGRIDYMQYLNGALEFEPSKDEGTSYSTTIQAIKSVVPHGFEKRKEFFKSLDWAAARGQEKGRYNDFQATNAIVMEIVHFAIASTIVDAGLAEEGWGKTAFDLFCGHIRPQGILKMAAIAKAEKDAARKAKKYFTRKFNRQLKKQLKRKH